MLYHYIKIAIRNLARNKVFTLINILGLAVGMGVCLLIYQYVYFEKSYDSFHNDADNIYRLTQTIYQNGENLGTSAFTTYGLGTEGKESIPAIQDYVRVHHLEMSLLATNPEKQVSHQENDLWYVDANFLNFFQFPLKYGSGELSFGKRHNIAITEEIAIKYFGDSNPIGKNLRFSGGVLSGDFIVSAVLNSLPENSHMQFGFLLPLSSLLENYGQYKSDDGWDWDTFVTYINVQEGTEPEEISKKLDEVILRYKGEELNHAKRKWAAGLQAIADVHLTSDFQRQFEKNKGSMQNVHFFSLVAIFILLMAWVNYINLSTAQAIGRAKAVSVRKSIGALKRQLVSQFLTEAALINLTAGLLALGLALIMLPILNQVVGKNIDFTLIYEWRFLGWFAFIVLLGTLLAGMYPAFVMSSYKPLSLIRPEKPRHRESFSLRKGLIVFQFVMSTVMMMGTYLIYQQLSFMKNQNLGMDIEKILVIDGPRLIIESAIKKGESLESSYSAFKNEVTAQNSISGVTASSSIPGQGYFYREDVLKSGMPPESALSANLVLADKDFFDTYGLEVLAQTEIPDKLPDWTYTFVNEEALEALALGTPEEAIGQELELLSYKFKVLGVVKNFHWNSLKDSHSPTLFLLDNAYGVYFSVKTDLSNPQKTIAQIESAYKNVFPGDPFHYFFLDEDFNNQYKADLQFQNLFATFSLLAIFIACMGLFALVSFSATLKTKEIGVRKVLGASVANLMLLLSREYLVLLAIAVILAIPVVVWGAGLWLENYAYRIDVGFDLILVPGLFLFLIALLTVSYRTYLTANANPVDSLRSE